MVQQYGAHGLWIALVLRLHGQEQRNEVIMRVTSKLNFELTEWADDENTRKRHVRLESSCVGEVWTNLQQTGGSLTPDELAAVQKIVNGIMDLQKAHRES